jgi:hypothetical protein
MSIPLRLPMRIACAAVLVLALAASADAQTPCPAPATLVVYADNGSRDDVVTLTLAGELRELAATCAGAGATDYAAVLECRGSGLVRCGTLADLRPGAWNHHLTAQVADSAVQRQTQTSVIVAGAGASNVVAWPVYARSFVVDVADERALQTVVAAAAAFSDRTGERSFVGFDPSAFPGAADPRTIELSRGICAPDGRHAGLCLTGSDVVIDALDARAQPGAVILSIGSRAAPVVRVYGSDVVLRGLVLQGTTGAGLSAQADTITISGAAAQGARIERCIVRGPTRGDALSIEQGAGDVLPAEIVDAEIHGAAGVGVKVTTAGRARVRRSCLHDNQDGGAVATLGGMLTAAESLVQHNAPGSAPSGLAAGSSGEHGADSSLTTSGNIVRLNGARGLSVTDGASASFEDDYVADNQFAGARVEAVTAGDAPVARFRGVALVCNHNEGLSGTCEPSLDPAGTPCLDDRDCCGAGAGCCVDDPGCASPVRCKTRASQGYGAVTAQCDGCAAPSVDLGTADALGGNAFTLNANDYPNGVGANVQHGTVGALSARGNQWERCGTMVDCDVAAVAAGDVRPADGASVDVEGAVAARAGVPVVTRVSPARPRAGELVRVFGRGFNAVDGNACSRATVPVAACSAENPKVAQRNRSRYGNLVRVAIAGQATAVDVVAATPTMLAFHMPFDCFAPAELVVSRRDAADVRRTSAIAFCDVGGCSHGSVGDPCDDDDVCTVEDACSEDGRCIPGPPLECGGPCMRCDPHTGCVPQPVTTSCDDGNACTLGDHCSGDGDVCVPGAPAVCHGTCESGVCDPAQGCVVQPVSAPCDDHNACTIGDHCRGDGPTCIGGRPLVCAGSCLLGTCDPGRGCRVKPPTAPCSDGDVCTERDHCRGDADVCVAGSPAICDDRDPCTVDGCGSPSGCGHEPLVRYDGMRCRLERVRSGMLGPPPVAGATGRGLGKLAARCLAQADIARSAEARGDDKLRRRVLAQLQRGVRRLVAKLARPRGLPSDLVDILRPVVATIATDVAALRAEIGPRSP